MERSKKLIEVFFLSRNFSDDEMRVVFETVMSMGYSPENRGFLEIPAESFTRSRGQYNAGIILNYICRFRRTEAVGVLKEDIYFQNLNFVFGLASPTAKVAVVSLTRMRPEFYGQPKDEELYFSRIKKEIRHELGHLWGLGHCHTPGCVMSFSNSIQDVDRKSDKFCNFCLKQLGRLYY